MRASNEGASLAKGISEKCSKKTNPVALLDHIDTPSAAKDLDILRQLSGDSKLNYLATPTAPSSAPPTPASTRPRSDASSSTAPSTPP